MCYDIVQVLHATTTHNGPKPTKAASAELTFGTPLSLPGEFLNDGVAHSTQQPAELVAHFRQHFRHLVPRDGSRHGNRPVFIFKNHATSVMFWYDTTVTNSLFNQPT